MNKKEVDALLIEVFKCPLKESSSIEDIFFSFSSPYNPNGWKLCIKKSLVDYKAACCLTEIVNDCKLKMEEDTIKKGYYVIHSK